MHIHHIKPKHMGGTDDPSNLIERTIEQHAEDHRLLFVKYGHWQDEVAWKGLLGLIPHEEAARIANSKSKMGNKYSLGKQNSLGHKQTEEHKKKISESMMGNKNGLGYKHTEEAKKKMIGNKNGLKIKDLKSLYN